MSDLLTEVEESIAYGTFNRPAARNALSKEGVTAFAEKRKPVFQGR